MKTLKWNVCLLVFGLALGACGSKGGGGSSDNTNKNTKSTSYYLSDGECYKQSNNSVTSDSNCKNLDFAIERGVCYNIKTDKEVSMSNCSKNSYIMGSKGCYDRSGDTVNDSYCEDGGKNNNGGGSYSPDGRCSGEYTMCDMQGCIRVNCNSSNDYCSTVIVIDDRGNFITCQ